MDNRSAREMLGALPIRMNEGGPVTYGKGATKEDLQNAAANVRKQMAEGNYDAAAGYADIIASGVSVDDAFDALGDTPETRILIDAIFTTPEGSPAYSGEVTAPMADDVAAYYGRVMQDGAIDAAERLDMQKIATDRGLSYADIVAAGVDPNILYQTAPAAKPVTPAPETPPILKDFEGNPIIPFPTGPATPAPNPFPMMPDTGGIYAAGQPALDKAFRASAPRTEVIEDVGGQQQLTGFDYTPAAKLLSATGSGFSFTPPSVTSRPRSLMGTEQLGRFQQGRAAQDFERLKRSGMFPDEASTQFNADAFNQLAGSYGSMSRSQLNALMRQQGLQNRAAQKSAPSAGGTIAEYIAANPDIKADYERQKGQLGGQNLNTFARNHYNTFGKSEMAAGTRAPFTLAALPPTPFYGREEDRDYGSQPNYTTPLSANTGFNRTYGLMAEGGPVKKPKGFADGGSASADLKALDSTDPLFITETVQEVNPDMVKREIPPFVFDGVERPTGQEASESKNMLENIISGAGKIPDSVGNYFVRPDETGGPSLVSPRQVGSDLVSMGGAIVDAVKEDDSFLKHRSIAEIAPITGEIISGADAVKFSNLANESRAAGDTKAADLYEQIVTLSAAGAVPLMGMGARVGRRAAINAAEEAIKKGSVTEASKMLNDLDPSIKYEGMRDATVQRLKDKGIMSDEEFRVAELDGYAEDPKFTYSIDDSGSNSSYITLKKTTEYDDEYGVLDFDEYTIRFSDHSLPRQYSFDRNMYNVSNDYLDETINGKSLEDAIDYVDRLVPATESARMLDEVDAVNAPRLELPETGRPVRASEYGADEFKAITRNMYKHQADVSTPAEMVARAERIEPGFQTAIRNITDDLGLVKSETFGVKQVKSLENKLKRGYELGSVTDPIRTRILINTVQEADEVVNRIADMMPVQDRGFQQHTTSGYFDRKLNVMYTDPNGERLLGEIQITTPEMLEAVDGKGHRLYEVERALTERYGAEVPTTHIRRFENMQRAQKELYQGVAEKVDPRIVESIEVKPDKDFVSTSPAKQDIKPPAKRDKVTFKAFGGSLGDARQKLGITQEKIDQFKSANKGKKQQPVPEVMVAAKKLKAGEISSQEYIQVVEEFQPIKPLGAVQKRPTNEQIAMALTKNETNSAGILGVNLNIADGTMISSRLDIPAYEGNDTWVVTLHDGTVQSGNAVGYAPTAVLNDVKFTTTSAKAALNMATKDTNKGTIARINGSFENRSPAAVEQLAKDILDGTAPDADEWVEVGMNPFRHSYFYRKSDGMPVANAEQVIQVGPLVLAKKVKTRPVESPEHLVKTPKGTTYFKKGGNVERIQNERIYI